MDKVEIICPVCFKKGYIYPSKDIINKNPSGITAINISPKKICSHALVVFIDNNMVVRDCFVADFQIEIPPIEFEVIKEIEIPELDIINVDLIKLNIRALTLSFIIRACLFKEKLLILIEKEFLHSHLLNFLKFIFKDSFEIKIIVGKREIYKKNKNSFKNFLVLDEGNVINDKKKILNEKNIKIERLFIHKFLTEYETKTSLILLKNEIRKAYILTKELSQEIVELSKNKGKEKIETKKIIESLKNVYNVKISLPYLKFLIDIVESYFKVNVPTTWKFFLFR